MDRNINELKRVACRVRAHCIRMITEAGSGHPGGSLSSVELLTALFWIKIRRTKENALSKNRDRFVLSKGHGVPTLYSILAERGLIDKKELLHLRKLGSPLQGHPDVVRLPYVEASTGSLGQGLSMAQGMALAGKIDQESYRVYCMVGDGEMQEGEVWEALMSCPKFGLNNLCVILDYNKSQIDGWVQDIMNTEPIIDKLLAFRWNVLEVDGHNFSEILNAYDQSEQCSDKPSFIIAHTLKGKGVSFMENQIHWHGVAPNSEQCHKAIQELEEQEKKLEKKLEKELKMEARI